MPFCLGLQEKSAHGCSHHSCKSQTCTWLRAWNYLSPGQKLNLHIQVKRSQSTLQFPKQGSMQFLPLQHIRHAMGSFQSTPIQLTLDHEQQRPKFSTSTYMIVLEGFFKAAIVGGIPTGTEPSSLLESPTSPNRRLGFWVFHSPASKTNTRFHIPILQFHKSLYWQGSKTSRPHEMMSRGNSLLPDRGSKPVKTDRICSAILGNQTGANGEFFE